MGRHWARPGLGLAEPGSQSSLETLTSELSQRDAASRHLPPQRFQNIPLRAPRGAGLGLFSQMLPSKITENSSFQYCSPELRANVTSLSHTHAHTYKSRILPPLPGKQGEENVGKVRRDASLLFVETGLFWSVGANPEGAQLSNDVRFSWETKAPADCAILP